MHPLLSISNISIVFSHCVCFKHFFGRVFKHNRIAIIGNNGVGKSALLQALYGSLEVTEGKIERACSIGWLSQGTFVDSYETVWDAATLTVRDDLCDLEHLDDPKVLERVMRKDTFSLPNKILASLSEQHLEKGRLMKTLSGCERMKLKMVSMTAHNPELILLDEPTNHLDQEEKQILLHFLANWNGGAIVATHDEELLHIWPNVIWHIAHEKVDVFEGSYEAFLHERKLQENQMRGEYASLKKDKKKLAAAIEKEKRRAGRTSRQGARSCDGDKMLRNKQIERSEQTQSSAHKKRIKESKREIDLKYQNFSFQKETTPRFQYSHGRKKGWEVRVEKGFASYGKKVVIEDLNFFMGHESRIAVQGGHASGKSTLFKAIMGDPQLTLKGKWDIPQDIKIGYIDQHTSFLNRSLSVWDSINEVCSGWSKEMIEHYLASFLFFDHRRYGQRVESLSGGEKVRLALALLAVETPDLLILDEVTNHLDIMTKKYLANVLCDFQRALLISSHDNSWIESIEIENVVTLNKGRA